MHNINLREFWWISYMITHDLKCRPELKPACCLFRTWSLVENGLAHFLPFPWLFHAAKAELSSCDRALWAGAIVFIMLTHFALSPILYSCIFGKHYFLNAFILEKTVFRSKVYFYCKLTSWQSVYKTVCSEFGYISSLCQGRFSQLSWYIKPLSLQSKAHLFLCSHNEPFPTPHYQPDQRL